MGSRTNVKTLNEEFYLLVIISLLNEASKGIMRLFSYL